MQKTKFIPVFKWKVNVKIFRFFFSASKNGKASLAGFLAKKSFFELAVDMGVFEVAEFESAVHFLLGLFSCEIMTYKYGKNKIRQLGNASDPV